MAWQPLPHEAELFSNVYIDETSQNDHHYLAIGGIIIPRKYAAAFEAAIINARGMDLPITGPDSAKREIKWEKVSRSKLPAYKRVVDTFFRFANTMPISTGHLDFHSTVVDMTLKGSKLTEIGFNKEINQLCRKFAREYPKALFHVYLDQRTTSQPLNEVQLILNRVMHKTRAKEDWPFRRIRFEKSHDIQALQVTDILLGALAYKLNGHYDAANASPARKELCDHVFKLARIADVFRDTKFRARYTIWHRDKPELKPKLSIFRQSMPR
jgi:uncharacterized protein DUF3800